MGIDIFGNILLAGSCLYGANADGVDESSFALARVNSSGQLDTTFNNGVGWSAFYTGPGSDCYASVMAITDRQMIPAGAAQTSASSPSNIWIVDHNTDGTYNSIRGTIHSHSSWVRPRRARFYNGWSPA